MSALVLRVSFVLLMHWVHKRAVSSKQLEPRLTITPPRLTQTPGVNETGSSVTILCQTAVQGVKKATFLAITRSTSRGPSPEENQVLANAADTKQSGLGKLIADIQSAEVTGSTDLKSISITLFQATCFDEGRYTCQTNIQRDNGAFDTFSTSKQLIVDVTPGHLALTAQPKDRSRWKEEQTMRLTCTGPVGLVRQRTKIAWVWEYKDGPGEEWGPYEGAKYDAEPGQTVSETCYQQQSSVLKRSISMQDDGRVYRCYVQKDGRWYQQFAAQFSVGTVEEGPGDDSTSAHPVSKWLTIGLPVFICLLVVTGAVFLVVIRQGDWRQYYSRRSRRNNPGVMVTLAPTASRAPPEMSSYYSTTSVM